MNQIEAERPYRYVVLLRAVSNVSMEPFREGMRGLGFTDVDSFGIGSA